MTKRLRVLTPLVVLATVLAACGGDDDTTSDPPADSASSNETLDGVTITVYSGRGEDLIAPVLEAFELATGATVDVRYGDSAEMALLIDTEGDNSPADVFISQSPGAVGFLQQNDRLLPIAPSILDRVDPQFRSATGNWVGITGRVRVLVYNTDLVSTDDLPASVLDLTDPKYAGMVAVAPANGSFQDFVTAMRTELGDDATAEWLNGMADNDSPNYAKNSAIVDAVSRGEVPMGLVNHYYLAELLEEDPTAPAANYVFPDGDLGSLLIVSAAAVVDTTDDQAAAEALLAYLLSDQAQTMSANAEFEYPLVAGVPAPADLTPLADLAASVVDLNTLAGGLSRTQELIDLSGIIR